MNILQAYYKRTLFLHLTVRFCKLHPSIFQLHPKKIFRAAYTTRLLVTAGLIAILIRVIYLLRESRAKDKQNELLQNAYLNAQLQFLKEELNPHFFFNALSSLSAIVTRLRRALFITTL